MVSSKVMINKSDVDGDHDENQDDWEAKLQKSVESKREAIKASMRIDTLEFTAGDSRHST